MAPRMLFRRVGPFGVALTAWDVWRRIPPKHRRRIVRAARKHGPRIATTVIRARGRRRKG